MLNNNQLSKICNQWYCINRSKKHDYDKCCIQWLQDNIYYYKLHKLMVSFTSIFNNQVVHIFYICYQSYPNNNLFYIECNKCWNCNKYILLKYFNISYKYCQLLNNILIHIENKLYRFYNEDIRQYCWNRNNIYGQLYQDNKNLNKQYKLKMNYIIDNLQGY